MFQLSLKAKHIAKNVGRILVTCEKEIMPEKTGKAKWIIFTYIKVQPGENKRKRVCGQECYVCWGTRCRYYQEPSVDALLKLRAEIDGKADEWLKIRRQRARGKDRYTHLVKAEEVQVQESEEQFSENGVAGVFTPVAIYLQQEVPHKQFTNLKEVIALAVQVLKVEVLKDSSGKCGVDTMDPQAGQYHFKRGFQESVAKVDITRLHDPEFAEEVAADRRNDTLTGESPNASSAAILHK